MAEEASSPDQLANSVRALKFNESSTQENAAGSGDCSGVEITCFSDLVNDVAVHFQIIRLPNQVPFSNFQP